MSCRFNIWILCYVFPYRQRAFTYPPSPMFAYVKQTLPLIFFVMSFGWISAQDTATYTLHQRLITQADGLPDRNVLCGLQDKNGFLWFGTRSGLCRYDGNQFVFLTKKSHGLRGTSILSLAEDDSVGIIITYTSLGSSVEPNTIKDVVNIHTLEVKPLLAYYPTIPLQEEDIYRVIYTPGKPLRFFTFAPYRCWTYTHAQGFVEVPLKSKPVKASLPQMASWLPQRRAAFQQELEKSVILQEDSTLITLNYHYVLVACLRSGYLMEYQDPENPKDMIPYFLRYDGTLVSLAAVEGKERRFADYDVFLWGLNYYMMYNLRPAGTDEAVVMTLVDKSTMFYTEKVGFKTLFQPADGVHIYSLFKDRQGAFWLCANVGIYKLTLRKKLFDNFLVRGRPGPAFNNSARGIYADQGLKACNLLDASFVLYQGDTLRINTRDNFSLMRQDSVLWIGTKQLKKFDLRTRSFKTLIDPGYEEIWSIFSLRNEQLLLGCTRGLARYDIASNTVSYITFDGFEPAKFIYKIFRNQEGQIMAVADNGLYILSNTGEVLDCYCVHAADAQHRLPCSTLYDVYEDKDGVYWIASNLEGLFKWNRQRHSFLQFGIENGFLSTVMYCIQEDAHQNLWVSTDYGLTRFNKETYGAETYTKVDGIADNEFNRTSSFKDADGNLYFGGLNGVTTFHPDNFLAAGVHSGFPLVLNGLQSLNVATGILEDRTAEAVVQRKIVLSPDVKSFVISFSLLDYEDRKHTYAYKLGGLDKQWNYLNEGHIRLGGLPYGTYTLEVKAQLVDGKWNDQRLVLEVVVPPPFYRTWWFAIISALFLIFAVLFIIKIRTRILKRKNDALEDVVEKRTEELATALNEQKAMLQEIHHRVKNNLQFIQAMIDMQINASKNESNQSVLKDTTRRINAMTMVHEMLYHKDSIETISLKQYLQELVNKLTDVNTGPQVQVHFHTNLKSVRFDINNCIAIGMITSELLSNSIKHAFKDTGHPEILIDLQRSPSNNTFVYVVKDNGSGVEESAPDNRGLGMRLIDIFARQLNGTYSLKNHNGLLFTLVFKYPVEAS